MLKENHFIQYSVLFLGLLFSTLLFFLLRYNVSYQFYSAVAGVVFYILWGVTHHFLEGRESLPIIMEYFLIGGIVVLLFALVLGI